MRIETLSIRAVTVAIFVMIGAVATVLSLLAGNYFRQAALDAQMSSLSRVIEVATQEMLKAVRGHTFELGMRMAHSAELNQALRNVDAADGRARLVALLDDPFINGFVGFANINLEKIRVYDLDLNFVAESTKGIAALPPGLSAPLVDMLQQRAGIERLKGVDALWLADAGPLHSTLVPIGGLRVSGYLEIIINPVFNLPDIGAITRTPIGIFTPSGAAVIAAEPDRRASDLPVEYLLHASDGTPAFKIVGYENVEKLDAQMRRTRTVTITGFLLLTLGTLLFALWLFNRFLFAPVRRMAGDMQRMAGGNLDLRVDKKGLRDFAVLAENFNAMAAQVRRRTGDLERLLDVDDNAILCFGADQEAVYFNRGASTLFGYAREEIGDLDLRDLFTEDSVALIRDSAPQAAGPGRDGSGGDLRHGGHSRKILAPLVGVRKDGGRIERDAVIRALDAREGGGYAVVLNARPQAGEVLAAEAVVTSVQRNEQRMNAVEQSLNSLLELARGNPGLIAAGTEGETHNAEQADGGAPRPAVREQAVNVMLSALACWEHDLGKSKLDLAEESRIWPVYIDKSTPTTRTLDKYLNLESCPKKPRTQRVIDTAEFVLRQLGRRSTHDRKRLQQALNDFRLLISGIRASE